MSTGTLRDEWMRKSGPFYPLLLAARLQTRLPLCSAVPLSSEDEERARPYLPLVAAFFGLALYVLARLLGQFGLPLAVIAALTVTVSTMLTGAWTEVALARVAEQLGRGLEAPGQAGPSRAAFPITLTLILICRFAALSHVAPSAWLVAYLTALATSRWVVTFTLRLATPRTGTASEFGSGMTFAVISLTCAVTILLLGKAPALIAILLAASVGFVTQHLGRHQGRHREDIGIAAGAVVEVLAFICFAS